ncbi:MAG: hypothetical protein ACI9RZ_001672, partial [Sphingobacteriales bacterium]
MPKPAVLAENNLYSQATKDSQRILSMRILLVEDDLSLQSNLQQHLAASNYR